MNFLKNLFSLPEFQSDTQAYTARMLRVVLGFIASLSVVYVLVNILNDPTNAVRYALQFAFILLTLVSMLFLIRKGQPRAASIILVLSTWFIFTIAAYTGGGIVSSAYMGYLVVLAMAGLVIAQPGWILATATLCAVSGYGLLYAEQNGLLPPASVTNASRDIWFDSLIYFALVASLQILASKLVTDALKLAREESEQKQEAREREVRRSQLLKQVIELGKEVTQASELDWCMKKIHQSVQKGLGFDRVGLFLYDENTKDILGTYGTDRQGNIESISFLKESTEEYESWQVALNNPDGIIQVSNYSEQYKDILSPEDGMYGVKEHVTLAAWSGKKPVALIAVDNVITGQPISTEKIEALRLFAGYAGLAITNARNLEAIHQELENFSYSVSHDLRSPLRAVVGFSKILLTDTGDNISENRRQYLEKIHENGRQMGLLIDDLLSFSRVGRQTIRLTTVELNPIIERIIANIKITQPDRDVDWQVADLPTCKADYTLIQIVITNLLENAYTYTVSQSKPRIEIGSVTEDGQTTYYVRDNGIGFEMEYADKIFRVFHRLHHESEFEGTGVGLAIVQRIIQRHGGKIWAKSIPDQGATFYFSLP
jgi:signal transduction histidine kinase